MSARYHEGFVGNPEIFEEILADDFREVDAQGLIYNRAEFIEKVGTKHRELYSKDAHITVDEMDVRIFDDFGQVHALLTLHDNGAPAGTIRYTDTYKKFGSEWKAISAHITGYAP